MARNTDTNTLNRSPTTRRHARQTLDRDEPTDVHDPGSRDDPDTPSFTERVKPETFAQKAAVGAFASVLVASFLYVSRIFPPGYHNPWVMVVGLLVAGYPLTGAFFREQGFRARGRLDTVILKFGSPTVGIAAQAVTGDVDTMSNGDYKVKEVKRTTYGGFVAEWLRLDDVLERDDLDLMTKRHRDRDEPSFTALDKRFTAYTNTELQGDVYVVDASSLDYDFDSKEVERRALPPDYLPEDKTGMLIAELRYSKKREREARNEITVVENLLEDMRKRVEDEHIPELARALSIVDRVSTKLGRGEDLEDVLNRIGREDSVSEATSLVDERVEDDLGGGS